MDKISDLQSTMSHAHLKPLPPVPSMRSEEVPERGWEYSPEILLKFKEEKVAREEAERLEAAGGGEGGFFGGFGGGGDDEGEKVEQGEENAEAVSDAAVTLEVRNDVNMRSILQLSVTTLV